MDAVTELYDAGYSTARVEEALMKLKRVSPYRYRELRDSLGMEYLG